MPDFLSRFRGRNGEWPRPWRSKVVPSVSCAPAVAEYLRDEGRNASPADHRRIFDERWPGLTPNELRDALDQLHAHLNREEDLA